MVHARSQQLPAARSREELGRVLVLFAAVAIALTGVGLGPGNARANQTYPAALAETFGPEAATALVAKIPVPLGTGEVPSKPSPTALSDSVMPFANCPLTRIPVVLPPMTLPDADAVIGEFGMHLWQFIFRHVATCTIGGFNRTSSPGMVR